MTKVLQYIIISMVFIFECANAFSQCIQENEDLSTPPCNGIISTNSDNPINEERPSMRNKFDWRIPVFTVNHPAGGYSGSNTQIVSPYHASAIEAFSFLNYYWINDQTKRTPDTLDFNPRDGWELIHKNNGYKVDETTPLDPIDNRIGPYFILYNKYSNLMRLVAGINGIGANQSMYARIIVKDGQNYNALFTKYGSSILPLSEQTQTRIISQGSPAPINGQFFVSDFRVNYDPCICNYQSTLNFTFGTRNVGDVRLEGRMVGTINTTNDGNSPLLNGRDFLTSVFTDRNFSIKGGMLTYGNIDKLLGSYYQPSTGSPLFDAVGRDAIKGLLSSGKTADQEFQKVLKGFLQIKKEDQSSGTNIARAVVEALGPVGAAAKFLESMIAPTRPSVSVIEAELALSGSVSFETPIPNAIIEIPTPGSKFTNNPTQVPDQIYPAYNEALGTFAVFQRPKVRLYASSRAYEPGSLKYYFNPAVPVNLQNTRILAALVYNYSKSIPSVPTPLNMFPTGNKNEFSSDFVPIESLHRVVVGAGLGSSAPEVTLRLQIFYEFMPNAYGKTIKKWEVLSYPIETTGNLIGAGDSYDRIFNGFNYTSSSAYTVLRNAIVNGTQSNSAGVFTTIQAGNSISLSSNSTLRSGMTLQAIPVAVLYNDAPTVPLSATEVRSFCSSSNTQYKAKELSPAARLAMEEEKSREEQFEDKGTTAFPNPTTGKVSFRYYVEEPSRVRLNLISTTGSIVATLVDAYQEAGPYEFAYDVSNLPAGVYIYTLETSKGKENRRLVLIK